MSIPFNRERPADTTAPDLGEPLQPRPPLKDIFKLPNNLVKIQEEAETLQSVPEEQ